VLSGRGLCDELITRPEESYRLCCVVVCDLETSRMGAPCIYDISTLRVKRSTNCTWQRARKKRDARSSSAPSLRIAWHLRVQAPLSSGNVRPYSGSHVQGTFVHNLNSKNGACFRLVCPGILQCSETVIAKYIFSKSNILSLMYFSYKYLPTGLSW